MVELHGKCMLLGYQTSSTTFDIIPEYVVVVASEYRSGSSGVSQGRVATKLEAWHQQRSIAGSTSTDLEGHSQLVGFIYSMLARKSEQTALLPAG